MQLSGCVCGRGGVYFRTSPGHTLDLGLLVGCPAVARDGAAS